MFLFSGKYQYQPLTPLHLLPITPLTDYQVWLEATKTKNKLPAESSAGTFNVDDALQQKLKIEPRKARETISSSKAEKEFVFEYETTV